jgi:hypothetical protein
MNTTHIISQDVFDKIRSRFSNLEMGDEQGSVTTDPKEARFFDFDFVVENNNLGRVSISINETGSLKIFYSQGILEETDDFVHQLWYDFLREMRMFAKRRLLRFDTRDITKTNLDKEDFQYLATSQGPKEQDMSTQNDFALSEAIKFEGGKKTSYRVLEKTKLIAKHKKSIEDESFGARTRRSNIQSLFIENQEGERFKYPFIHIAGAKAMQRHVANGGRPYDELGQAIVKMSEDIAHLTAFNRQVGSPDNLNNAEQVNEITGKTATKLQSLKRTVEGLCNQNYYEKWSENFVPNAGGSELDEATLENYKSAFTVNSFKEDLTQYFPLIHRIMQEAGEVDLEEYVEEAAGLHPMVVADLDKLKTLNLADRYSAYANIRSYFKDNPELSQMASDLIGGYYEADMLRGKYKTDAANAKYKELEPMHQAFIKQALGQEQGDEEPPFEPDEKSNFSKPDNPNRTGRDAAQALAQRGMKQVSPADSINAFEEWANDLVEGDSDEDMMAPPKETEQPTAKAIAEFVYTMYNKNHQEEGLGPFPKGATGVVSAVKNKFGEETEDLAKQFVEFLSNGGHEVKDEAINTGASLKSLGGNPRFAQNRPMPQQAKPENPSSQEEGMLDKAMSFGKKVLDKVAPGDEELLRQLQKDSGVPAHAQHGKPPMATPNRRQQQESSDFDVILKLAGVKK